MTQPFIGTVPGADPSNQLFNQFSLPQPADQPLPSDWNSAIAPPSPPRGPVGPVSPADRSIAGGNYTVQTGTPEPQPSDQGFDPDKELQAMEQAEQAAGGQTQQANVQSGEFDPDAELKAMDAAEQAPPPRPPGNVGPQAGAQQPTAIQNSVRGFYDNAARLLDNISTLPVFKRFFPQAALHKTSAGIPGFTNYATPVHEALGQVGEQLAAGQKPDLLTARGQLEKYGLLPDLSRISGRIGENTLDGLIMSMGLVAAAPKMAATTGMSTLSFLSRSMGGAMQANPWATLVFDTMAAGPGATIGSEVAGEHYKDRGPAQQWVGQQVGGMIGGAGMGLVTAAPRWIAQRGTQLGLNLSTKAAKIVADTIDATAAKMGSQGMFGQGGELSFTGKRPAPPLVGDDLLDKLKAAELDARHAGEIYVQSATNYRNLDIAHPDKTGAGTAMAQAKANEVMANKALDEAWEAIPPESRVGLNSHDEAIRAEWADAMRSRGFAEEQLAGDKHMITDKINEALDRVKPNQPGLSTEEWAGKVSEGIQHADRMADQMESRLYERADLSRRMPSAEGPNRDLDAFEHEARLRYAGDTVPTDQVTALRNIFNPGPMEHLPTIEKVRSEASSIGRAIREERAKQVINESKVAHLSKLYDMSNKWISDAFPDDVTIRQAREFSVFYHDLFSRSEIQPFLRANRQGGNAIKPEDTITELLKRPKTLNDIYAMTERLKDHPAYQATYNLRSEPFQAPGPIYRYNRLGQPQQFGPGTATQSAAGGQPVLSGAVQQRTPVNTLTRTSTEFPPGSRGGTIPFRGSIFGKSGATDEQLQDIRYDRLFGHTDAAQLTQLQSDIQNGIRSQFQEEVRNAMVKPTANGETPTQAQIALRVREATDKWEPKIKAFSDVASQVKSAIDDTLKLVNERRAIEKSALAKYIQGDPDKAVASLWGSKDPAAMARNLINGEAGLGGFARDPAALEGFRAALTDKLFSDSQFNPEVVLNKLRNMTTWRLLNSALGSDRVDRIERLAQSLVSMQKQAHSTKAEIIITGAKFLALKLSALMPKIGEGAELQQAAIFSKTAARVAKGMLHQKDAKTWLTEAVRDPNIERLLLSKSGDPRANFNSQMYSMKQDFRLVKSTLNFGSALIANYEAAQHRTEPPIKVDDRPALSRSDRTGWNMGDILGVSSASAANYKGRTPTGESQIPFESGGGGGGGGNPFDTRPVPKPLQAPEGEEKASPASSAGSEPVPPKPRVNQFDNADDFRRAYQRWHYHYGSRDTINPNLRRWTMPERNQAFSGEVPEGRTPKTTSAYRSRNNKLGDVPDFRLRENGATGNPEGINRINRMGRIQQASQRLNKGEDYMPETRGRFSEDFGDAASQPNPFGRVGRPKTTLPKSPGRGLGWAKGTGAPAPEATPGFAWNAERLQQAQELKAQGNTFTQIAHKLGTTRSAVSGKLFRNIGKSNAD